VKESNQKNSRKLYPGLGKSCFVPADPGLGDEREPHEGVLPFVGEI